MIKVGYVHLKGRKRKNKSKKIRLILLLLLIALFFVYTKNHKLSSKYFDLLTKYFFQMDYKIVSSDIPVFNQEANKYSKPLIYIYNTHQTENYKSPKIDKFNLDYNVMFASQLLKLYLEEYGIDSIVEEDSISKILSNNNLKYKDSYKASRILLEDAKNKNPDIRYFIDLHRDSSVYEKTTCKIDDTPYAKILFVVGLEHDNYEDNLKLASILNEKLIAYNKDLSRGIMKKSGPGVNGIYNQDFNKNVVLIELGGQYNTFDEANNTLKVLAKILSDYLTEKYEKEKSI